MARNTHRFEVVPIRKLVKRLLRRVRRLEADQVEFGLTTSRLSAVLITNDLVDETEFLNAIDLLRAQIDQMAAAGRDARENRMKARPRRRLLLRRMGS